MNKIVIIVFFVFFFLFSCGTYYPMPASDSDSLIVGYVEYDFPDGFFNMPPKLLRTGIKINYTNLETGQDLYTKTNYGYFRLVCDGNSEIVIKSIEYKYENYQKSITLAPIEINQKIQLKPHKIIYLGHLLVSYTYPEIEGKAYQPSKRGNENIYDYKIDVNLTSQTDKLEIYFVENFPPEHEWKSYEVLNMISK